MFEHETISHHIERSIVEHLQYHEYARFSELRPKAVDTNLFAYHLKMLGKHGYVHKTEQGYTLTTKGMLYVDRLSSTNLKVRMQPKIITMLLVRDTENRILLSKRQKQPYINRWTLPYGKLHIEDVSVESAALREAEDKLHYSPESLTHAGDAYITVTGSDQVDTGVLSKTLAHITTFTTGDIEIDETLRWFKTNELGCLDLAPAVSLIVDTAEQYDRFFFEELRVTFP